MLARMACRYSCYYLTRNSLTYTAPVMVSDPALKMDITQARHLCDIMSERGFALTPHLPGMLLHLLQHDAPLCVVERVSCKGVKTKIRVHCE